MNRRRGVFIAALFSAIPFGCGSPDDSTGLQPIDDTAAVMWVRQTTTAEDLLNEIVDAFNADWDGLPVKIEYAGDYGDIYRKVSASVQAKRLPAMTVAYESMTTEWAAAGAVRPLDEYVDDPVLGFTEEELADFFPGVIETNRYASLGGGMFSFPFSKAVLVMYVNRRVLAEAGIEAPPTTWTEFIDQSRAVKRISGKFAYAIDIDCSTIDGFLMSMGGEIMSEDGELFPGAGMKPVFDLYKTLIDEELGYLIPPRTFEDRSAFAQDDVAFIFRSSSHLTPIGELMEGDTSAWAVSVIPQANPDAPRTVLYGPNACIFAVGEEQTRAAWAFVRYFNRPENSVKWALGTGYLPVRRSARELPELQAYWNAWEGNRVPFDCLAFAEPEPNVAGWQAVRGLVETAAKDVLTGIAAPEDAAAKLAEAANRIAREQAP